MTEEANGKSRERIIVYRVVKAMNGSCLSHPIGEATSKEEVDAIVQNDMNSVAGILATKVRHGESGDSLGTGKGLLAALGVRAFEHVVMGMQFGPVPEQRRIVIPNIVPPRDLKM